MTRKGRSLWGLSLEFDSLGMLVLAIFSSFSVIGCGQSGKVEQVSEEEARGFAAKLEWVCLNGTPQEMATLIHSNAIITSGEETYTRESYMARLSIDPNRQYSHTLQSLSIDTNMGKATLQLDCRLVASGETLLYSKTIVLLKRDGKIGIVERRSSGKWRFQFLQSTVTSESASSTGMNEADVESHDEPGRQQSAPPLPRAPQPGHSDGAH